MKRILSMLICAILLATPVHAEQLEYITIDPQAILPEAAAIEREYPATLIRGERAYDLALLLEALLGEGYEQEARGEYATADQYISTAADKLWRYLNVEDGTGEIWYYDSMITGERGGEYEPPKSGMTEEEGIVYARDLLKGVVSEDWLAHPGIVRGIHNQWSVSGGWMTEAEYDRWVAKQDLQWILFEHWNENGVRILDDELQAAVGADGLDNLRMQWHDFATADSGEIPLMPLEEAVKMANSTRAREATLLYAQIVYSNWLTGNDEFNLSWYLVTDKGNYVVDCVRKEHKCDMYEY